MAELHGSSEAAEQLRRQLQITTKNIFGLLEAEQNRLKGLSASCQDDSYEQMAYYVQVTKQYVTTAVQDVVEVDRHLSRYIALVEMVERNYHGGVTAGTKGQKWHMTDSGMTFSNPQRLATMLDTQQGKYTAAGPGGIPYRVTGTCGLCSVENISIMAGQVLSEQSVVQLALDNNLCTFSGGTDASSRQSLLALLGIASHQEAQSIENIAAAVMEGRGVIASVNANKLYGRKSIFPSLHAITVTSVDVDRDGKVTGITVCDSNARALGQSGAHTYPVAFFKKVLTRRRMNVMGPIR